MKMKSFSSAFKQLLSHKVVINNMVLLVYLLLLIILSCECSIKKSLHPGIVESVSINAIHRYNSSFNKNNSNSYQTNPVATTVTAIKHKHFDNKIEKSGHLVIPLISKNSSIIKKLQKTTKKSDGFITSAIQYFLSSPAIQRYAVKIKADLSNYIETERQKLFSGNELETVARQFQAATTKPSWMESAMVPMAFITFAMFLMDIMQRMFPYYGGANYYNDYRGGQYYDYYNRVQMPVVTTTEAPFNFKISSLFGRSNKQRSNSDIKTAKRHPKMNYPNQKDKQKQSILNKIKNISRHSYEMEQSESYPTNMYNTDTGQYYYVANGTGSASSTETYSVSTSSPIWSTFNYDYSL